MIKIKYTIFGGAIFLKTAICSADLFLALIFGIGVKVICVDDEIVWKCEMAFQRWTFSSDICNTVKIARNNRVIRKLM